MAGSSLRSDHSAAVSGNIVSRSLIPGTMSLPAHTGHPEPFRTRSFVTASHSWPQSCPRHRCLIPDFAEIVEGSAPTNSAATSGQTSARLDFVSCNRCRRRFSAAAALSRRFFSILSCVWTLRSLNLSVPSALRSSLIRLLSSRSACFAARSGAFASAVHLGHPCLPFHRENGAAVHDVPQTRHTQLK